MPAKKKGPAFDMDSAFSGLFSTASVQSEEIPANNEDASAEVVSIPVAQVPPVIAQKDPVSIPVVEPIVNHRKSEDQLTRQYTITLKKGTHENLRDIAWYTRQSVSSILNNLADEYIRQHAFELEECHKINRR